MSYPGRPAHRCALLFRTLPLFSFANPVFQPHSNSDPPAHLCAAGSRSLLLQRLYSNHPPGPRSTLPAQAIRRRNDCKYTSTSMQYTQTRIIHTHRCNHTNKKGVERLHCTDKVDERCYLMTQEPAVGPRLMQVGSLLHVYPHL